MNGAFLSAAAISAKPYGSHLTVSILGSKRARSGAIRLMEQNQERKVSFHVARHVHTRRIMTSVALTRAAAVWPGLSFISRAELAVMIEVIC